MTFDTALAGDHEPACRTGDLGGYGLVSVSGDDARDFLGNQLSNDVKALQAGQTGLGSYCTPKGRMLACFHMLLTPAGDYLLFMPADRVEPFIKRLSMYVLRSKVTLSEAASDTVIAGCWGSGATAALEAENLPLPAEPGAVSWQTGLGIARFPGPVPRYLLIGNMTTLPPLWTRLTAGCPPASTAAWAHQDILAGLPSVYAATSEEFVPQMANLELLGGVSFRKGCYPGQEIVARMQYLGKLKQRMFRGHVATEQRPEPGTDLFAGADTSGQSSGKIVDARPAPAGGYDLLAVVRLTAVAGDDLRLGSPDGLPIELRSLPYDFPEPDN